MRSELEKLDMEKFITKWECGTYRKYFNSPWIYDLFGREKVFDIQDVDMCLSLRQNFDLMVKNLV